MGEQEDRSKRSVRTRIFITSALIAFIAIGLVSAFVEFPVSVAKWLVPFEVNTPAYLPVEPDEQYAKIIGFDRIQLVYATDQETVVVWATSELGWNNVADWEGQLTLEDGTTAYYEKDENRNMQMISWQAGDVEYAVDYEGAVLLPEEELVKIASSFQ